jgi:glutathione S-transferase
MLTLYHAPMSRSTRIMQLLRELGILDQVEVKIVDIVRHDGSGRADPANPHPEGKVPLLVHDGVEIWESVAIVQYLADLFPEAGLSIAPGDPLRGRYLSWLAWGAGVVEPMVILKLQGVETPGIQRNFRGLDEVTARIGKALEAAPYLCGNRYTAADLNVSSLYGWQPSLTPDVAAIRDWIARCQSRPSVATTWGADRILLAEAA